MKKSKVVLLVIFLIILDLLIKFFVSENLVNVVVVKNFFSLHYVLNDGAAFNIFASKTYFLIIIALVCMVFIVYEIKNNLNDKISTFAYSLVLGGLLGNFIDRLADGYIVDYLSFRIFNYDFPVFNLADMLIVVGIFLVLIKEIRGAIYEVRSK